MLVFNYLLECNVREKSRLHNPNWVYLVKLVFKKRSNKEEDLVRAFSRWCKRSISFYTSWQIINLFTKRKVDSYFEDSWAYPH